MEWSKETYRLDQLETRFKIPCVIHVNEGFYSDSEADGFSSGDIIGIDRKMTLHKVAAQFAGSTARPQSSADDDGVYCELAEEILVPLNYKGKLRVLCPFKRYTRVSDMAFDSPRYATVMKNFVVTLENKKTIVLTSGTALELDRLIPSKADEDGKLVVEFDHKGLKTQATIPLSQTGMFKSEPDKNEYTIREAIYR